jgi:hypothetical protein
MKTQNPLEFPLSLPLTLVSGKRAMAPDGPPDSLSEISA